jgi:K(+)-stimulated pyrophosphate-energized sodium pump
MVVLCDHCNKNYDSCLLVSNPSPSGDFSVLLGKEPVSLFVAYLISIAVFGLFQALFMANAGGCWDNAKKVVEVDLKEKGTPLHDATVIGDTVGDPFKDTAGLSLNILIKLMSIISLVIAPLF